MNYEFSLTPPHTYLIHHLDIHFCPVEGQVYGHPVGLQVFGQGEVFGWAGAYKTVQGNFKVREYVEGSGKRRCIYNPFNHNSIELNFHSSFNYEL